jgi:hypothetical protein
MADRRADVLKSLWPRKERIGDIHNTVVGRLMGLTGCGEDERTGSGKYQDRLEF